MKRKSIMAHNWFHSNSHFIPNSFSDIMDVFILILDIMMVMIPLYRAMSYRAIFFHCLFSMSLRL